MISVGPVWNKWMCASGSCTVELPIDGGGQLSATSGLASPSIGLSSNGLVLVGAADTLRCRQCRAALGVPGVPPASLDQPARSSHGVLGEDDSTSIVRACSGAVCPERRADRRLPFHFPIDNDAAEPDCEVSWLSGASEALPFSFEANKCLPLTDPPSFSTGSISLAIVCESAEASCYQRDSQLVLQYTDRDFICRIDHSTERCSRCVFEPLFLKLQLRLAGCGKWHLRSLCNHLTHWQIQRASR